LKKIIAFCGLPGSGKTSAIESIKDLGYIITMGDVVRNEAKIRNLKYTGENLGKVAKGLREKGGKDIIAIKCVELINSKNKDIIFVDGIRSVAEINIFRKFWKFPIVAITVSEKIRFKRLFERNRGDDPKTISDLKLRDEREIEFGLKEVLSIADYTIINDSSIEELIEKTRKISLEILKNY